MNIAGVVVNALPKKQQTVEHHLLSLDGVEIHAVNEQGRMVVTIEAIDQHQVADTVTAMHSLEGVLSAAMVYHHFEPSDNSQEHSQ